MSAQNRGHSAQIPCSNDCSEIATAVVVIDDDGPLPRCDDCTDKGVQNGHREYPIESFYELTTGADSAIMYDDWDTVIMTEYQSGTAWIEVECPTTDYFELSSHV